MVKKLAIIGTAGRGDDASRINRGLYNAMFDDVRDVVDRWEITEAVSGGAAVADHLAVRAFNEGLVAELTLYLPAEFKGGLFVPNPAVRFNPGATCNNYHKAFSKSCDLDSLGEIENAISKGATVRVFHGFHRRNSEVAADCAAMVAYTFGSGESRDFADVEEGFSNAREAGLKDGGTAHTWGECWKARRKRHVNLFRLARTLASHPEV